MRWMLICLLLAQVVPLPRTPRDAPAGPGGATAAALALTCVTERGPHRAQAPPGERETAPVAAGAAAAGSDPEVRWQVRNPDAREAVPNVVVHLAIHRLEDAPAGYPEGALRGSVVDTAIGVSLAPRQAASGACRVPLSEPGDYLLALELLDPRGNRLRRCGLRLRVEEARP